MHRQFSICSMILAVTITCALPATAAAAKHKKNDPRNAILWSDPGNIHARDLFYGVGGKEKLPAAPFKYLEEDKGGTSPKFEVSDSNDRKWKGKLGPEVKPEVAATRLLWAVGYFANENYYESEMTVAGIYQHQKRGHTLVGKDDVVHDVRLQRHPGHDKKTGDWSWRHNRFKGTREFDGLRVMMALLNNWDLKDENNAIFTDEDDPARGHYEVSDVGASFGTSGKSYTDAYTKNNFKAFKNHKFISKVTPAYVDFNFPTHPSFIHIFEFPFLWTQYRNHWIGRHIPREHVEWIAGLLAQLSPAQIHDAFRAAGYTPAQVDMLANVVEQRIQQMSDLKVTKGKSR